MKRSGGAGDASSSTNKRSKASSKGGPDENAAEAESAPEPPDSSLSDAKLAEIEIKTNRSPVMVLWAAVRLSLSLSLSLSLLASNPWLPNTLSGRSRLNLVASPSLAQPRQKSL